MAVAPMSALYSRCLRLGKLPRSIWTSAMRAGRIRGIKRGTLAAYVSKSANFDRKKGLSSESPEYK